MDCNSQQVVITSFRLMRSTGCRQFPSEFHFPSHCEVYPLNFSGSTVKTSPRSRPLVRTVHSTSDGRPMGKRGHSRRARGHILGGAGTSATGGQIGASSSITNAVRDEEAIRQSSARDQPEHAGPAGADEPDGSDDDAASGDSSDGESQSEGQARGVWAEYHPGQGEQGETSGRRSQAEKRIFPLCPTGTATTSPSTFSAA